MSEAAKGVALEYRVVERSKAVAAKVAPILLAMVQRATDSHAVARMNELAHATYLAVTSSGFAVKGGQVVGSALGSIRSRVAKELVKLKASGGAPPTASRS